MVRCLVATTVGDKVTESNELDSPYIDAPIWPWAITGWVLAALFGVLFVLARLHA